MDKNTDKITKLEMKLSKICQEIYELSMNGRHFIPKNPYVLVRVLPKEHKTEGGIWLAETSQNKPVYEGIVLDVWRPYTEERIITDEFGNDKSVEIVHRCSVEIGDRVAFPHSEGIPVGDWLDDRYYRLVREGDEKYDYHRILGTLTYTGDVEIQGKIRELTKQLSSITFSGVSLSRGADVSTPYGTT